MTACADYVTRWAIACGPLASPRHADPRQAAYTYADREACAEAIAHLLANSDHATLAMVHGPDAAGTYRPERVRCYAGTLDPCGFEPIDIGRIIERAGLTMKAEHIDARPDGLIGETPMDHWRLTLARDGRPEMTVYYSTGHGHRVWAKRIPLGHGFTAHDVKRFGFKPGERVSVAFLSLRSAWAERLRPLVTESAPPDLSSVLDSLASDAAGYDNARNFEDWAAEYGYDTDSRKAERAYRACGESAKELAHLLGRELYDALLWNCERL